jgi:hypothetical protein
LCKYNPKNQKLITLNPINKNIKKFKRGFKIKSISRSNKIYEGIEIELINVLFAFKEDLIKKMEHNGWAYELMNKLLIKILEHMLALETKKQLYNGGKLRQTAIK